MKPRELTNQVFGDLTVLRKFDRTKAGAVRWLCRCRCGNETVVEAGNLFRKERATRSCGKLLCEFNKKRRSESRIIHGHARTRAVTRLHHIWTNMNYRGRSDGSTSGMKAYANITVEYKPWREDFLSFRDWALANGYQDTLQIDRIDNTRGYFPENCRWVTPKVNMNNTSACILLTAFGETKTIPQWEVDPRARVRAKVIRDRFHKGWHPVEAISAPLRQRLHADGI